MVTRDAFFWAWPFVNVYNKCLGAETSKDLAYAGPVPAAPLNRIVMLYNELHFFAPNEIDRYLVDTKNKALKTNADGSLTIYVQADWPAERTNWLPAPKGPDFTLYLRTYWPKTAVIDGSWTPSAVEKQSGA